jgi:hypothetical protein
MGRVPLFSKKGPVDIIKCEFCRIQTGLDLMVNICYLLTYQNLTKLEDMYDHLTSTNIFSLIMNKTFLWFEKKMKKVATSLI